MVEHMKKGPNDPFFAQIPCKSFGNDLMDAMTYRYKIAGRHRDTNPISVEYPRLAIVV